MSKSANQKLKLLYLMSYLLRASDEAHPVSMLDIIEELGKHDIAAERKSIYGDIEALRGFGLDIIQTKGKTTGYYIGARDFELPELKLLVDSVQSSKFITQKKTLELIKKLEGLASVYDGQLLQRQVFVRNRVKSMNESVYYNVDEISSAITGDRVIKFKYFDLDMNKKRSYRKAGAFYEISPFALMWDDENYYMLGYDETAGQLKHYRVDKMSQIGALERTRSGKEEFKGVDMSAYSKQTFGMFTGELVTVRLRFKNHLAGPVIDRFGRDVILTPDGDDCFTVQAAVAVSPQFYAWVFGFAAEAELLEPPHVREQMKIQAQQVLSLYE